MAVIAALLVIGSYEAYRTSQRQPLVGITLQQTAITVLPFDADDSLSGIGFEIADRLRELEDFYVTSRTRTVEFAANEDYLKLDTRYLVRGSFMAPGEIQVSLFDQAEEMWSMTVGLAGDDISGAANQVARRIAKTFNRKLPAKVQEVPQQVYLQYLTAKVEMRKPNSAQTRLKAQTLLQEVVLNSPRFAEARAGLCEAFIVRYRSTKSIDLFEGAEKHCHRAQTLAKGSSYVHIVMGKLYTEAGEYELALELLGKALNITPFSTEAMRVLSRTHKKQQQYQPAEDLLLTAIAIEPNYWANYQMLAGIYFAQRECQKVADYFNRQIDLVLDKA